MNTIRALAAPSYGPLTQLKVITVPIPAPGQGEVRVRVHATALNPADFKVVTGTLKFLHARNFPLVVGYDYSGTIDALGPGETAWKVGDEVFGFLPYGPGNRRGAFAEMLLARTSELARKPASVSHLTAAGAATPGVTALQCLRDLGRLASGGQVLITGVSGGVGPLAVGIARRLGADVTAVGSGRGLEFARKHGARKLIDRKTQDVLTAEGGPYDVILDAAAVYRWKQWKGRLKPGGTFVTTLPSAPFVVDLLTSALSSTRVRLAMAKSRPADLTLLGEWLASGLEVPIDSTIPITDVAAGLARLKGGQVGGRVVVEVLNRF